MENKEEVFQDSFLVIDGNSILNRAFYGLKLLATKDGLYTNAIYGFLNIYYMISEKLSPKYVAIAFDLSAPTFRHKMYSEYKAGRHAMPEELKSQFPLMKDVLNAMNIPILEKEGFEADDILGTIAANNSKNGFHTYILTGDRDSFQLISNDTTVILPTTKFGKTEYTYYTPEALYEKYGITPKQVVDVKALMGDTSDNIPGVPGVGEKTAYPLIQKYDNIEYIYEHVKELDVTPTLVAKLEKNKDSAMQSKFLATINTQVDIAMNYDAFEVSEVDLPELIKIFTRLEFKKFIEKYTGKSNVEVTTDKAKDFYENLEKTKFKVLASVEDISKAFGDIQGRIIVTMLDGKIKELENAIVLYTSNNMYVVLKDKELQSYTLKLLCECNIEKIGYNIKRIYRAALDNGINTFNNFVSDIMIEYYLINSTDNNFTIENIAYNILDITAPELLEVKKNVQTNLFDMLDTSTSVTTDVLSSQNTKYIYFVLKAIEQCSSILKEQIEKENLHKLYYEIEFPLIEVLANIEYNGMYVDKVKLQAFGEVITKRIEELTRNIYSIADEEFNINSPQQLAKVLFEKLQIPYPKKTKGSSYSTDKETLESIIGDYEIIQYVLEYRKLAKLKSTYVEALTEVIADDGRIHTTFMQTATVTGRLSSVEPNLQNIPVRSEMGGQIRECFISEKEDYVIVDADYSQIELRVLAHMANDLEMINGFKEDKDIHSITASQVFKVPEEEVTKELRSKAKAVNFGIVYGISEYGLSQNIHSTRADAGTYIRNYLAHYKGIDEYMKRVIEEAKEKGVVSTIFGRKRKVPEIKSANYLTRTFGERIAMNMPIQGTAADIMKLAMIKVHNALKEQGLRAKVIMQVHDELLVETHKEDVEKVKQILKICMENAVSLNVPLVADVNIGKSWLDAK